MTLGENVSVIVNRARLNYFFPDTDEGHETRP